MPHRLAHTLASRRREDVYMCKGIVCLLIRFHRYALKGICGVLLRKLPCLNGKVCADRKRLRRFFFVFFVHAFTAFLYFPRVFHYFFRSFEKYSLTYFVP